MVYQMRLLHSILNARQFCTRQCNKNILQNVKLKVYNPVTKNKETLKVQDDSLLTWYTCGPTVYDSAHLGHASCYVKLDIIQRILKTHFGYNVVSTMNITDIDDKIITRSKERNISVAELARHYENEFWQDMHSLNIPKPNIVLRVTENIEKIVNFITKLEKCDMAYRTSDGSVYFDVTKYEHYGKFKNHDTIDAESDLGEITKKSSADFALWKAGKAGEPSWDSPWCKGRPGWHIECSTLASLAFGSNVDIHAGGIDLRFPHHENEEAQSCAFHSKEQWVNQWLHTGHLHLKDAEKMSKSLKNTISIQELLQSTSANVFRMACFMSHYRSGMEYSAGYMSTADSLLKLYKNFIDTCRVYQDRKLKATLCSNDVKQLLQATSNNIHNAFCDDFDTPKVVKHLGEFISRMNTMLHSSGGSQETELAIISSASNFVQDILGAIGIDLLESTKGSEKSDINCEIIEILSNFRQDVRQTGLSSKNSELLKLCDSVRDRLRKQGIIIKDQGKKSSWSL